MKIRDEALHAKRNIPKIYAVSSDGIILPAASCSRKVLCAVVEICIFRNTEASGEIPTKLACFST